MGLISPRGRTSWIFSSCGRCSRLTMGISVTRSGGLRKGQSACELLWGLSGLITRNLWNFQRVLHTLGATQEVHRHTRFHSKGSTRVPPTFRGAPFPTPSSRGGILSQRGRERIPGVPVASQEEALSTGKARGTPGSCHIPRVPQMSQSIPGKPVFPALRRLSS